MYEVIFYDKAQKQFKQLPLEVQYRISNYLNRIKIRPFNYVKRVVGTPYFRGRVGEYRIILDIKQNKIIIFVVEIGHRRNIYKKGFS
jgi:mRNA interferase RelE/StbE